MRVGVKVGTGGVRVESLVVVGVVEGEGGFPVRQAG